MITNHCKSYIAQYLTNMAGHSDGVSLKLQQNLVNHSLIYPMNQTLCVSLHLS